MSPITATKARAVTRPTPGIVIKWRTRGSSSARSANGRSSRSSSASSAANIRRVLSTSARPARPGARQPAPECVPPHTGRWSSRGRGRGSGGGRPGECREQRRGDPGITTCPSCRRLLPGREVAGPGSGRSRNRTGDREAAGGVVGRARRRRVRVRPYPVLVHRAWLGPGLAGQGNRPASCPAYALSACLVR